MVTDGERFVKASRVAAVSSAPQLAKRYGMPFEQWQRDRAELERLGPTLAREGRERGAIAAERERIKAPLGRDALWVREHERTLRQVRELRAEAHEMLGRAYRRPEAVRARLAEIERREGREAAARRLVDFVVRHGWRRAEGIPSREAAQPARKLLEASRLGRCTLGASLTPAVRQALELGLDVVRGGKEHRREDRGQEMEL